MPKGDKIDLTNKLCLKYSGLERYKLDKGRFDTRKKSKIFSIITSEEKDEFMNVFDNKFKDSRTEVNMEDTSIVPVVSDRSSGSESPQEVIDDLLEGESSNDENNDSNENFNFTQIPCKSYNTKYEMDLIVNNNSPLKLIEHNTLLTGIMGITKGDIKPYLERNKFINEDWNHQAFKSYRRLHVLKNIWNFLNRDQKIKECHYFYDCIYRCKYNSDWINNDLYDITTNKFKNFTDDHPFSARMVMRIIMTDWPDFMNDLKEYTEVLHYITNTIGITAKENQDVKVLPDNNGELKIHLLTKDKYSNFTFRNKNNGDIKNGLPFNIPEWFENGEKKRLISDKDIKFKELNKMSLKGLNEEIIRLNLTIDVKKNNKDNSKKINKNKEELIIEILNTQFHNVQMSP